MSKAQSALEAAETECAQPAKDVEALRAAMSPPAASTHRPSSQLQRLEEAAKDMISELAATKGAGPAHLRIAAELPQQLVKGFQVALEQAQMQTSKP